MKLNIGSGGKPLEGYVNIDRQPEVAPDVLMDIGRHPWPFRDGEVEEVVASHILEHLTTDELFHCLREMYRVCAPGAVVKVRLPHPRSDVFLCDPTHQRPFLPSTLLLFSQGQIEKLRERGMGLTPFGEYLGVNFRLDPKVKYHFADGVDSNAPDIVWQMDHLHNIVREFECTLTVVK